MGFVMLSSVRHRSLCVLFGSLVAVALSAPGGLVAQDGGESKKVTAKAGPVTRIQGRFVIDGSFSKLEKRVAAGIEDVVGEMFFIKRPIARRILEPRSVQCKQFRFKIVGKKLAFRCDEIPWLYSSIHGKPTKVFFQGLKFKMTTRVKRDKIIQTFSDEYGRRVNTFELGPKGKVLKASLVVISDKLPRDLKGSQRYKWVP